MVEVADLVAIDNHIVHTLAEEHACSPNVVASHRIVGDKRIGENSSHVYTMHRAVLDSTTLHIESALALVADAIKRGVHKLAVIDNVIVGMGLIGHVLARSCRVGVKVDGTVAPTHRLTRLSISVKTDVMDIDSDALILGPGAENGIGSAQHAVHGMVLHCAIVSRKMIQRTCKGHLFVHRINGCDYTIGTVTGGSIAVSEIPICVADIHGVAHLISINRINTGYIGISREDFGQFVPYSGLFPDNCLSRAIAIDLHAALQGHWTTYQIGASRDIKRNMQSCRIGKGTFECFGIVDRAIAHCAIVLGRNASTARRIKGAVGVFIGEQEIDQNCHVLDGGRSVTIHVGIKALGRNVNRCHAHSQKTDTQTQNIITSLFHFIGYYLMIIIDLMFFCNEAHEIRPQLACLSKMSRMWAAILRPHVVSNCGSSRSMSSAALRAI